MLNHFEPNETILSNEATPTKLNYSTSWIWFAYVKTFKSQVILKGSYVPTKVTSNTSIFSPDGINIVTGVNESGNAVHKLHVRTRGIQMQTRIQMRFTNNFENLINWTVESG